MYNNYSYHVIVGVFLQTLFSSVRGATIKLGWKDNADPRNNVTDMEKSGKYSPNVIKKLRRREACHQNCWEALGIFCASVVSLQLYRWDVVDEQVAGNQAGLSAEYMTKMSVAFFLIRCAYSTCYGVLELTLVYSYLKIDDKKLSYLRSLIYWAGNRALR